MFQKSLELSNPGQVSGSSILDIIGLSRQEENVGREEENISLETNKKIVKNGSLNLKVDNIDRAGKSISKIAENNKGNVVFSNFYQTGMNVKIGIVKVKIPVANFENAFVDFLKK